MLEIHPFAVAVLVTERTLVISLVTTDTGTALTVICADLVDVTTISSLYFKSIFFTFNSIFQ